MPREAYMRDISTICKVLVMLMISPMYRRAISRRDATARTHDATARADTISFSYFAYIS